MVKSKEEELKEYKDNLSYCYYIGNEKQIKLWEKRIFKLEEKLKKGEKNV